ncbi:ABC transporter permease [Rariglobus hedericola]|uniref:ABC transporter permease n=1 Tax=Rariglobus hedericola TaxID=2597822 RepID=A0A556QJA3_9BACT|nr:ABC transporter permease [Rariglobus hedericola]TSJ76697.1 ABC transporter permease [Rariglobus hedericola]
MRFLSLIFTNLRRHRLRALIGVAGIGFGVAAMLAILAIVTGAIGMFERILSTDSHYLVFEKNVSDLFFSSVTTEQVRTIRALPQVEAAHPLLFGIVSAPGNPVVTCFGIEADDPRLVRGEWRAGSRDTFGKTTGEVYLGARSAEFLKAKFGETVAIGRGTFKVGGIFKNENGFEDGGVFLPLPDAQAFFHREGAASVVAVKLRDQAQGAAFKAAVEAANPGVIALENREFSQSYNSFKILNFTAWAVGICAFFLGGLGVANTMLLSVFGRIREIAVLRVCGFSERQVAALIFGEAGAIALGGLVLGFSIGLLMLAVVAHMPQFNGYVQARVEPLVVVGIVVTALITAIAGAIYPARFASRIQPAEALRYE